MVEPIQILLIVFVLFALSRVYLRFKEGTIKKFEVLFWTIVWVFAIFAIITPTSLGYVSTFLGIGRPADLILYVAVILLFYLNFRLYVIMDEMQQTITKVVRETAIQRVKRK